MGENPFGEKSFGETSFGNRRGTGFLLASELEHFYDLFFLAQQPSMYIL
jgi:hypothetical protein